MKSILVTSLNDEVNLIQASHLVNAIRKDDPHAEVSLLTFKDLESAARTVANVRELHFIDRFKIEHLKSGALYSDAFAINTLVENLFKILESDWDQVINFSNDEISAYLAPMLKAASIAGSSVSRLGTAATSDRWAAYRNFYKPAVTEETIDSLTCSHHSAGVPLSLEGQRIAINPDFTMVASQNFARIRSGKNAGDAIIVGVNLSPSEEGEFYSAEFLTDLIETLESSVEYKPVLLLRGKSEEKFLVDALNKRFQNSLISINMDITAMPSVLANLDYLVTKPNLASCLADAMETKVIETPQESQANFAGSEGNFVVRVLADSQTVDDVVFLLNQENDTILPMGSQNTQNKIYVNAKDDLGLFRTLIRGPIDLNSELTYHISRCYHYALLGYPVDQKLIDHLRDNTTREELTAFTGKCKEEITSVVKVLLATLRSLQSIKQSEKNTPKFVQYLDQLMLFGKQGNIAQAAVALFEASIENISFTSAEKNMEAIEKSLFGLKKDLQVLTQIFESLLAETSREARKEL